MGSRRFILAITAAALVLATAATPASAKKPTPEPPPDEGRPLTAQEQFASDRRAGEAEQFVTGAAARGDDLASLACVPLGTDALDLESATAAEVEPGAEGEGLVTAAACAAPQGFLTVEARDQTFGHYCGPAVGQVIANYSWGVAAWANKYTQGQVASWMGTDRNGQTGAFALEAGLEVATARSPRRPANWDWVVLDLWDRDGDGWVGDQLDAYVRSNISGSRMPLAISVKPHDPFSPSGAHLFSWPVPVNSVGHWVAIYGWVHVHDGTDRARMYYTDSSRDEGGATGKFWTPTRWFTLMILEHTRRIVW
jgi:hypothetical protein